MNKNIPIKFCVMGYSGLNRLMM